MSKRLLNNIGKIIDLVLDILKVSSIEKYLVNTKHRNEILGETKRSTTHRIYDRISKESAMQ